MIEIRWNIADIIAIAVALLSLGATVAIAYYVQKWDRRTAENTLLWEVANKYWRSAIALYDNSYDAGAADPNGSTSVDVEKEVRARRAMIQRTVEQIRVLDGEDSRLANAFQQVASIENWNHPQQPAHNRKALAELTVEMTRQFGSRRARMNAEAAMSRLTQRSGSQTGNQSPQKCAK